MIYVQKGFNTKPWCFKMQTREEHFFGVMEFSWKEREENRIFLSGGGWWWNWRAMGMSSLPRQVFNLLSLSLRLYGNGKGSSKG